MLAASRCDLRAECTRVVTCERARDLLRNSTYFSRTSRRSLLPELLGEDAELMTDQDIEDIRRHAETMAWIVVEIYQEQRRCSE